MKLLKHKCGFTLVELMVALFVSSILVLTISKFFMGQEKKTSGQISHTESLTNLRLLRSYITMDFQKAGYNSRCGCFDRMVVATSSTIEMGRDINEDGDIADADEYIAYIYDSVAKKISSRRSSGGALKDFLENISVFEIKYYNDYFTESASTEVATPDLNEDEILKIKVSATALVPDPTVQNQANWKTESMVFRVYPRNVL